MEDSIKFVELVERFPCLYNNNLAEYSQKGVTERAWASIGEKLNWSVGDCKEKWKNLRNAFVRSLKAAPSGSAAKAKKPYYLHDAMEFVLPYVKPVQHIKNTSNITLPEMEEEFLEEDDQDDNNEAVATPYGSKHDNPEPVNEKHSGIVRVPLSTKSSAKKRKRRTQEKDEVDVAVLDYIKAKKESTPAEDSKQMFLMSLLPDVRSLSDENLRRFKIRTMLLLEELLDEQKLLSTRPEPFNQDPLYVQNIEVCTPAPSSVDAPAYTSIECEATADEENEGVFYIYQ